MKRKFEEKLIKWKDTEITRPLMVVGARQIGKTYLIDEFCKKNFKNYIYINLFSHKEVIKIFESNIDTSVKMEKLEFYLDTKITEDTVIFFDEIQESEELISSLKYMCESTFPYKIVCAGSLLGVKLKRFSSSFPVGKVNIEYMHQLDFEEFLMATNNQTTLEQIKKCFNNFEALDSFLHEKALKFYNIYLCIGGMPSVIQKFINNNCDILSFDKSEINLIINAYLADMNKYVMNIFESNKIEKVYNTIPSQISKENKKFMISNIEKNARKREYESAIDWLLSSKLVIQSNEINKTQTPLKGFMTSSFKLYLSDIGILCSLLELNFSKIMLNEKFMYKGVIAENYVATQLSFNNVSLYYWQKNQVAEIDFLIDHKDGIIPVEVKCDDNTTSKSLNYYIDKYNPPYSIRISSKNFGFENNIKSIPLYAVFCIDNK